MATPERLNPFAERDIARVIQFRDREGGLNDPVAERIYRKWLRDAFTLPRETKDEIGVLWMRHILKVDDQTITDFDYRTREVGQVAKSRSSLEIGMRHAGIRPDPDPEGFWRGVSSLDPGFLTEADVEYLVDKDKDGTGAWAMISVFVNMHPSSLLLTNLETNAVAYK